MTDEDSDQPFYPINRFGTVDGAANGCSCNRNASPANECDAGTCQEDGSRGFEPPGSLPSDPQNGWIQDRTAAINALVSNGAFIAMLCNAGDSPSRSQYGDPLADASDANYSNWDAQQTLSNLEESGLGNSFQAEVIRAGLQARTFGLKSRLSPRVAALAWAAVIFCSKPVKRHLSRGHQPKKAI